jgi:hypothetical protein
MIKSRRIRWLEHVASMEDMKNPYECLKEREHLEDLGLDRKLILNAT